MTNLVALRSLCNAIASSFYPDNSALNVTLFNAGIDPDKDAVAKDKDIFKCAASLVLGYVEGSRSENGVSTSVSRDAILKSLRHWCAEYDLDADEIMSDELRVIEDGTHLW